MPLLPIPNGLPTKKVEPTTGIEPVTYRLRIDCTTAVLRRLKALQRLAYQMPIPESTPLLAVFPLLYPLWGFQERVMKPATTENPTR